ncbi:transposase [Acinetobacter pittii]|uniref:IS3 family transposase n=1 Tax=Acinetobacter pittii TaxID=48296 RepID=UPI000838D423|nr:IS3 family transposase [Acinetobacter pittii]OCY97532.1 transposase [Acinetobacter pittii]OCZ09678.1 transposase [Acinetobacter pittii]
MYSYEDRLRAVRLYLKLGRRMSATLRQLGYPTKNSLKAWLAEFERNQDLRRGYQRIKRQYTDEQKQRAVDHYIEQGYCLSHTIRSLGYPSREALRAWIRDLRPEFARTVVGSSAPTVARSRLEKQQAVIALNLRVGSAKDVADTVGVSRPTLYNWQHRLLGKVPLKPMTKKKGDTSLEQRHEALLRELAELESQYQRLRMENAILEKASELIKKDMGINPLELTSREKTKVVDALRVTFPLANLLCGLKLARSTYFYQRLRQTRPDKYTQVREVIRTIFEDNYRCYGYRRIDSALRLGGMRVSEKVVRRLMAQERLVVRTPRRRRFSAYAGDPTPAVPNLLNRDFHASAPNTKWLTDLTEIHIPAGKVYVSPIVDCFDGLVVAWNIGTSPDANLVNTMLDHAVRTLRPGEHPVIHSDRGSHYRWPAWIRRTENAQLTRSMSKKGCSPDNAACEGFFGRLKTELIYPRNWQHVTLKDLMTRIDAYIHWYNERRIKVSLGGRSPIEYRHAVGLMSV